MYFFIYEINFF